MKILKTLLVVVASVAVCGAYSSCAFFTNNSSLPSTETELPGGEGPGDTGTPLTVEEAAALAAETVAAAVTKALFQGYGIPFADDAAGAISGLTKDGPMIPPCVSNIYCAPTQVCNAGACEDPITADPPCQYASCAWADELWGGCENENARGVGWYSAGMFCNGDTGCCEGATATTAQMPNSCIELLPQALYGGLDPSGFVPYPENSDALFDAVCASMNPAWACNDSNYSCEEVVQPLPVDAIFAGITCGGDVPAATLFSIDGVSGTLLCMRAEYFLDLIQFELGSYPVCFDHKVVGAWELNGCVNAQSIVSPRTTADPNEIPLQVNITVGDYSFGDREYMPPSNPLTITYLGGAAAMLAKSDVMSDDIFDVLYIGGQLVMNELEGRLAIGSLNVSADLWHRGDAEGIRCYSPSSGEGASLCIQGDQSDACAARDVCGDAEACDFQGSSQMIGSGCYYCAQTFDAEYQGISCSCQRSVDPVACTCTARGLFPCIDVVGVDAPYQMDCENAGRVCDADNCCVPPPPPPCGYMIIGHQEMQLPTTQDAISAVCGSSESCEECAGDCCAAFSGGMLMTDGDCCAPPCGMYEGNPLPTAAQANETACCMIFGACPYDDGSGNNLCTGECIAGCVADAGGCDGDCCAAFSGDLLMTSGDCCAVVLE